MKTTSIIGVVVGYLVAMPGAEADQCVVVEKPVAEAAKKLISASPSYRTWCITCGEKSPGASTRAFKVETVKSSSGDGWEVKIDGFSEDLANLYVSSNGSYYVNVGVNTGCVGDEVLTTFMTDGKATSPSLGSSVKLRHVRATVLGANDEWLDTGITLSTGDWVFLLASGEVSIKTSGSHRTRDPAGAGDYDSNKRHGAGSLEFKIGRTFRDFTDYSRALLSPEDGALKFRVRDSDYTDNSGEFSVVVLVVPHAGVPQPTLVR